jgi:leader peptidase (prepilin peptidase)/N-methyltransferase
MSAVGPVAVAALTAWAAALITTDVRYRRLPNVLTLPGALAILSWALGVGLAKPAILGALALSGVYLAVHLVDPSGLGAGDVKLAVALGALTGAFGLPVWLIGALGAPLLTAVAGAVAAVRRRGALVPHGPSMCVASLAAVGLAVF